MSSRGLLDNIKGSILIGDGAMGTMIQNLDLEPSKSPEFLVLEKPEHIIEIHKQYIEAGADIIETNTFGGNRLKLEKLGIADKIQEINKEAVRLAREAAGDTVAVAGSVGPTGKIMKPYGELSIDKAIEVFTEQISILVDAGADAIIIETMSDLAEIKAALLAAQDFDIPVIAQMTYTENGTTLTGTPPEVAAITIEGLGADVIGVNCVAGLKGALPILRKISKVSNLPLSIYPNAGLPVCVKGETIFPETPEEYVKLVKELFKYNVRIIGGCCGTSPEYISALKRKIDKFDYSSQTKKQVINTLYLSGNRDYLELKNDSPVCIIGEKLNPTGRKDIKEALKKKDWSYLRSLARKQLEAGAKLIDVNIGIPGIDKIEVMKELIHELQLGVSLPLVIDSNNPDVLEAGLKEYIGKPLVNSVNGEQSVMEKVFPLVKRYGAAVIGLTLDDKGIPETVEGRMVIARKIVDEAVKYGIEKHNIYIDTLTLTAGSDQEQVMITLETLRRVKEELGVKTTLGASNISHGLPERELINEVFLSMAIGYGLDMPIANPFDKRIHHQIRAANLITNRDKDGEGFINFYAIDKENEKINRKEKSEEGKVKEAVDITKEKKDNILDGINESIIKGDRTNILNLVEKALIKNNPQEIIDKVLIPAIQEVGELYDRGTYFLPQLLKSAETMQKAFDFLKEKMLTGEKHKSKATILLATVKGDIHDIGKNIVKTIFLNHGYDIIDLGSNVDSDHIVEIALKKNVDFVGLSSLMTTTLDEMKKVINLLGTKNYRGHTIIGGAVTSQEFADDIGADIYAKDALDGVRKINSLLSAVN